jgi:hypothetical protein
MTSFAFYQQTDSIKGILLQPTDLDDIEALGCKQVICNMASYQNPNDYMSFFSDCKSRGIRVTLILLNDVGGDSDMLPPGAPVEGVGRYGFYADSEAGEAAVRRYAKKVASTFKNVVSNYIIGNEINDEQVWCYTGYGADINANAASYAKSFRIFYEEIKAANPEAQVYVPFDMMWTQTRAADQHPVKDFLPLINAQISDLDYGIAWHPYPQNYYAGPEFMNDSLATDSPNTRIINLKNLHVLTDYMQNADMLSPNGTVRHLILSEMGFTSACDNGEERQAAAIQQAYEKAKENPYVEAFMLERQVDAAGQVAAGGAFGLWTRDENSAYDEVKNTKKLSWETYRNLQ